MHELSIVRNIIEMVSALPELGGGAAVRTIRLRVGEAAGVEPGSLEFCFRCLVAGTPLGPASLEIERVPFGLTCGRCEAAGQAEPPLMQCPACGSTDVEVRSGCELDLVSIEVDGGEGDIA